MSMAVETTTKQMALSKNPEFLDRVIATMSFVAGRILDEPANTPYNSSRVQYARMVTQTPNNFANQAISQIVMGVNVINTTVYDEATKTATCTIKDIDLESQINALWNSLAGIATP